MAKKYVPEGVYLACDCGTSPSTFRISHHENTSIYAVPMATEADRLSFFNIKPMGLCKKQLYMPCSPKVKQWDDPQEGIKINGNRLLLEDSTCKCMIGGKITIHFDRESAVAASAGNGKMPSDYIKEGFDWLFEGAAENRAIRDQWIRDHLPDWMVSVAHAEDWFGDFSVSLVEGAVDGVVGLGETVYQVAQDPVGTAEALGGMAKDAYNWTTTGENWTNLANDTWEWTSNQSLSSIWEGTQNAVGWVAKNPRKIGNTVGEFIPDAVAVYLTAGGSAAVSAGEVAVKEVGEEVAERAVREAIEEGVEKAARETVEEGLEKAGKELLEDLAGEAGDIPKVVSKAVDDKIDDALKKFDPANATSKQKGNFGEMASHKNMSQNPNLNRIGDPPPTGLDDTLKKGIDGIYENSNPPPKFVIDEAKYGSSQLNPNTLDGPQMSNDWVRNRLKDQVGKKKADEIMQAMDEGEVDKVLSKIDETGNVTTQRIDASGKVTGPWP